MSDGLSAVSCLKMMSNNPVGNPFGKTSVLRLIAAASGTKAFLRDLAFTAPFKVMTPFERDNGWMQVMAMAASAGIMEGDNQEITIRTEPGVKLECISQSFEKIHKMKQGAAFRKTHIVVERDSILTYRPLPVIPYAGSAFDAETTVELQDSTSRLVYQEIISCGRAARGERFEYRFYHSLMEVYQGDLLIYRENCRFDPMDCPMEEMGLFEGFSHMANLLLFHIEIPDELIEGSRDYLDGLTDISGGITRTMAGDVAIRLLGNQAQYLQDICDRLLELMVTEE